MRKKRIKSWQLKSNSGTIEKGKNGIKFPLQQIHITNDERPPGSLFQIENTLILFFISVKQLIVAIHWIFAERYIFAFLYSKNFKIFKKSFFTIYFSIKNFSLKLENQFPSEFIFIGQEQKSVTMLRKKMG